MSTRDDLMALGPDKLAALANRGLVKRAQKMLAKDAGPSIELDGELVIAIDGDIRTELPRGVGLADCRCTCSATKICRHRVAAVLGYQAKFGSGEGSDRELIEWSPGEFDDDAVLERIGKRAFARAKRRRNAGYVATLLRPRPEQDAPSAKLATCSVRFLVPHDLAHVRCDCAARGDCEHIAVAVWAFRLGDENPELEQIVEVSGKSAGDQDPLAPTLEVVRLVLNEGVEGASASLRATFAHAHQYLNTAGMLWPADALEELEGLLTHYQGWSESYAIEEVSRRLTEIHARARASVEKGYTPRSVILGTGQAPETELAQLRLVGLGARVDAHQGQLRVRVFFADPSSQTTLVWTKAWPREVATKDAYSLNPQDEVTVRDSEFVAARQVLGVRIQSLAAAQVVTQRATRKANGVVRLRTSRTARASVTPQSGNWQEVLASPLLTTIKGEHERRQGRPPRYLRARILTESIRVIAIKELVDLAYRPDQGALEAVALDENDDEFRIRVTERDVTPHAILATAEALAKDVRFVSGPLERDEYGWVLSPLAIAADGMTVPDLANRPITEPVLPSIAGIDRTSTIRRVLAATRSELDATAQRGLARSARYVDALDGCRQRLEAAGLRTTASRLLPLVEGLRALAGSADSDGLAEHWLDASLRLDLALERA